MSIPIKYNVRNLTARWVTTLMTVLGIGLVVWWSCILFGLVEGLKYSLTVSGDPLDLIVLRQGATSEISGGFESAKSDKIKTLDGIARDDLGQPLAAGELLYIPSVERSDLSRANLIIRGIEIPAKGVPVSQLLRPNFEIVDGQNLSGGKDECIVSKSLSGRFKGTRLGETLKINEKEQYRVVGIFKAGGSAAESEVWVDARKLEQNTYREGSVSCVQLRASTPTTRDNLIDTLENDVQYKLFAQKETDYFLRQTTATTILTVSATIIAILLMAGALFAAANTMYAAVSSRTREIGTLRALGFSRRAILMSFLTESIILCALGGAIGLLATIPFTALSFSTVNNFAEATFGFRLGPMVLTIAAGMTVAMGIFGGLFPAISAIRMDIISALREI